MGTETLIQKQKRLATKPSKGLVRKRAVPNARKRSTWCDNFLVGGRAKGADAASATSHTWIHRPLRKMRLQGNAKILLDFGEQVEGAVRDKAKGSRTWRNY